MTMTRSRNDWRTWALHREMSPTRTSMCCPGIQTSPEENAADEGNTRTRDSDRLVSMEQVTSSGRSGRGRRREEIRGCDVDRRGVQEIFRYRRQNHCIGKTHDSNCDRYQPAAQQRSIKERMSPLFLCLVSSFLIFSQSTGSSDTCVVKKRQKLTASPEPGLTKCQQYSSHSCCSQEHLDAASSLPFPWAGCRSLSSRCEEYVSRVQCMYLCSPHLSKWGRPGSTAGIHELPICDTFCDEWFDACKEDLICSETADLKANCSKGCITYKQKFGSGEKMCDTIWKHSFVAMTEQCFCITPPEEGADAAQLDSAHAELDHTQEGSSGYPDICFQDPHSIQHNKRVRRALRKRSILLDLDGSGSGNGV